MKKTLGKMMEIILEEDFSDCNAAYEIRDFFRDELREDMGAEYDRDIAEMLEEITVQQWKNANPNICH